MFGYDSKPTSSERKAKLADEMISITSIEVILGKAEEFNKLYISKLNAKSKLTVLEKIKAD